MSKADKKNEKDMITFASAVISDFTDLYGAHSKIYLHGVNGKRRQITLLVNGVKYHLGAYVSVDILSNLSEEQEPFNTWQMTLWSRTKKTDTSSGKEGKSKQSKSLFHV